MRLTCHDFSPEDASWTQHWIDKAEKADSSVPNTKADKPSKRDNFKGGGKKSDFDPHLSARQTAAHVAGVLTTLSKPENASQADVCAIWRFYAEEVHDWLTLEEALAAFYQGAKKTLDASVIPDDIDPAYEQAQADMDAIDETFPF